MPLVTARPPQYPAIRVGPDNASEVAAFIGPTEYRAPTECEPAQILDQNHGDWRPLTEGLWLVDTPIFIFILTPAEFDAQFQML